MRVVLITSPTRTDLPNYIIPTGIISLAAWLEHNGHQVQVVDAAQLRQTPEEIARRVAALNPELVGVGGIITAYRYIISLSHVLRSLLPNVPQVLGGQITINNVQNCYEQMSIDYMVHGYGEIALEKLVRHVEGSLAIEDIPGVSYRRGSTVVTNPGREYFKDINQMPLPAYHLINMEHYATVYGFRHAKLESYLEKTGKKVKNYRTATVMGTLGCTDRCSFCVHEQEYVGLKIFSIDYLINHIRFLKDKYDIHVFGIGEEMFLTRVDRAREFIDRMNAELPEVFWMASTRASYVTKEMVATLETGNCYCIGWGYESGSERMLELMKKRISSAENEQAYLNAANSNLVGAASLMVGNVGEDNQTIKETRASIRRIRLGKGAVFYAAAYPGSRIWDWALERKIIPNAHEYLMRASDRNADSNILCNLTPYPNWVLHAWNAILRYECDRQERHKVVKLGGEWSRKTRLKSLIKTGLLPILSGLVDLYFLWYRASRLVYRTAKDRQYEFAVDSEGGMSPACLNVNKPQRYQTPEKLAVLLKTSKTMIPIHDKR